MAGRKYTLPVSHNPVWKPYLSVLSLITNNIANPRWRMFDTRRSMWRELFVYWVAYLCICVRVVNCDHDHGTSGAVTFANIDIKYHINGSEKVQRIQGHYGTVARRAASSGVGVHVRTIENLTDGCQPLDKSFLPSRPWIAVIERGVCDFNVKINNAAKANATAVIIYGKRVNLNHVMGGGGNHSVEDVISLFVDYKDGQILVNILENYGEAFLNIKVGEMYTPAPTTQSPYNANNTSVLFVSLSFIVLIIISLAWLVFYYIQRCRYANAKERLRRRLANAAKKAIAKIPQRSVKIGDKELDPDADQCAVCIEPYKQNDVTRILPCKHVFHKSCVDPWLLEKRSCPMCKMDILRAFGMHLNGSQESVPQDPESGMMPSSPAIEEADHMSTSEEQGAVGGVKIVLYQRPSSHYQSQDDVEFSSEGSLDCRTTECHVECTTEALYDRNRLCDQPPLSHSVSLESVHTSDYECNEGDPLMSEVTAQGTHFKHGSVGSLCSKKSSSSLHHSSHSLADAEH